MFCAFHTSDPCDRYIDLSSFDGTRFVLFPTTVHYRNIESANWRIEDVCIMLNHPRFSRSDSSGLCYRYVNLHRFDSTECVLLAVTVGHRSVESMKKGVKDGATFALS